MENKGQRKPSACIHRHELAYVALKPVYVGKSLRMQVGFQKPTKGKFFALKTEIWNESHIVWELFQTAIFIILIAIHSTFSKHT